MTKELTFARPLRAKSTIGIIATGSPVEPVRYQQSCKILQDKGYALSVPLDPSLYYADYTYGFSNGSPAARAEAFMALVDDPKVDVILTARGGYGSLDILPLLDYQRISRAQKLVVGMSDATVILMQCVERCGIPAVHGPGLATSFPNSPNSEEDARSVDSLLRLLSDRSTKPKYKVTSLREGEGEGRIIAGNLSMLLSVLGTPYDVNYDGRILVVEEVGDAPFQIHRAFTQLKLAGKLDSLAGLVLGRFSKCESAHGPSVEDVIQELLGGILRDSSYPVVSKLPFGHWGENQAVPLACLAAIKGEEFQILESPLVGLDEV